MSNCNPNQQLKQSKLAPDLPDYAQLTESQINSASTAGKFLDELIDFLSEASPLTPMEFHLASALTLGSISIARRLYVPAGVKENRIYPNLYIIAIGPSTRPRKTTGIRVLKGLIYNADLQHLLLAERQTPEALTLDMSLSIPSDFDQYSQEIKTEWERERAFAAQRGWILDEASHLFESYQRDYSSGLLPLTLDLYDSSEYGISRNTINRGRERIIEPYLTIYGCTTFEAMKDYFSHNEHWRNGLWARFVFVLLSDGGVWKFYPPAIDYPDNIIKKIRYIATELLGEPKVSLKPTPGPNKNGKPSYKLDTVKPLEVYEVKVSCDARKVWEQYSKATSWDMLDEKNCVIPEKLHANYGRLGTMLIKIATILAVYDADSKPITIEEKHAVRAQMIVEDFRENLHNLLGHESDNQRNDQNLKRISEEIEKIYPNWLSRRDIHRLTGKTWEKLGPVIDNLCLTGLIERRPTTKSGPKSEEYRWIP